MRTGAEESWAPRGDRGLAAAEPPAGETPPEETRPGPGAESTEREAAWARGKALEAEASAGEPPRDPVAGIADPDVAKLAFAALAENVRNYAIFLMDPEGIITYWGEGARLLKWWTKGEAEGAHLRLLYPDGGSEDGTAEGHLRQAAETGEYTGEGHRIRRDRSTFWARVTLTALRGRDGRLLGFAKVTRDLTAERAAEAARQTALGAAEEASRLKGQFLATVSHEIRTPLNAIMAYTDLLGMETAGALTEAQHQQLGKIRMSSQHLLGLVDDVLDLSRIESGRMVVGTAGFRIGSAIREAMMLVEQQAARREVALVDAVSGFSADYHTLGDLERVRQILVNLLSNAVKFTRPGGRITVSAGTSLEPPPGVELHGEGPWVYVRVEDTGQGIPPERIEPIFEPFVQADMGLTRQHGGTGLGLSISRSLARLMGGDLSVRSEEGVGSAFFLWLPAAVDEAAPPVARAPGAPRIAAPLAAIGDALLEEMDTVVGGYVRRLLEDPATPSARGMEPVDLEDHLRSFLSETAQTLRALDLDSGAESEPLRDGTATQRTISERHGRQRARLGWGEDEVRREFGILREEVESALRRRLGAPPDEPAEGAVSLVRDFIDRAEQASLTAFSGGSDD